ncbi:hypothetical protein NUW58_g5742 [Xylaria curta]|uniref:Uncharacterized protein n=1 Tax=Xylaria curta TaxID=42375 RepID=A0ACC1P370_9PEZI|nr:hypothetical protein NUW58_g5742 [Xylaria curta]
MKPAIILLSFASSCRSGQTHGDNNCEFRQFPSLATGDLGGHARPESGYDENNYRHYFDYENPKHDKTPSIFLIPSVIEHGSAPPQAPGRLHLLRKAPPGFAKVLTISRPKLYQHPQQNQQLAALLL